MQIFLFISNNLALYFSKEDTCSSLLQAQDW